MSDQPGLAEGTEPPTPQAPTIPPTGGGSSAAGARPVFLPNDVDPTVFDEAFLRQLERLLLLMRSPVRGGPSRRARL